MRFKLFIKILSSGRLALILVGLFISLSIAGALLPQEGLWTRDDIKTWQESHPLPTRLLKPLGLFHVFNSVLFLSLIVLLGINTLACTLLYIYKEGGLSWLKGPKAVRNFGFVALHLGLLLLLAGGFWTSAFRMDGYIILTEGQRFIEEHQNYQKIQEGPFRQENHQGFSVLLEKVKIEYEKERFPLQVSSELQFLGNNNQIKKAAVKVNHPVKFQGLSFTQDKTGFSPRLVIRNTSDGRIMIDSFIALQTFNYQGEKEYRDFLPLPFLNSRVIVMLYPSYIEEAGHYKKTGEEPDNPLLLIEKETEKGKPEFQGGIAMGEIITIGDYSIEFSDLRSWSAFRVGEDRGLIILQIALWIGLISLILRYIPDLLKWFSSSQRS